jgi:LemA protein
MTTILIVLGLLVAVAIFVIAIYNGLVQKRALVEEGWSGIETQLKRRANLIPNLVETVKGYASHESGTLEKVTEMRSRSMGAGSVAERAEAEQALSGALANLFAVAEAYPDLKANQNFQQLQTELSDIENEIQLSRRYYNGTVRDLNIMIDTFPNNLIAGPFGFKKADYFEIDNEEDRAVPEVKF